MRKNWFVIEYVQWRMNICLSLNIIEIEPIQPKIRYYWIESAKEPIHWKIESKSLLFLRFRTDLFRSVMMIKKSLHGQIKKMNFSNTAYIFFLKFTLISINKLKRERFIWDMHKNTLQVKIIGKNIYEIFERHELAMIEYNPVQKTRSQQKTTLWHWRALSHCRSKMINQLRHKKAWRQLLFKKNTHGTQKNQDNVR